MSPDIPELLAHIEDSLRHLGRLDTLELLRPGIRPERVGAALAGVGLPPNDDLAALYAWHDGTDTSRGATLDDLHLFPGFYLLSLHDAVANYRSFREDERWTEGWMPLFANGGGDFYVVEVCAAQDSSVRHFRIDESERPVEFGSLSALLQTLAASFDEGVFYVDRDGYLEMDDQAFAALAATLNPTVDWWHD